MHSKRLSHSLSKKLLTQPLLFGAGDRGRTDTVSLPLDFESSTSANSITPACNGDIIAQTNSKIKCFLKKIFFLFLSSLFLWILGAWRRLTLKVRGHHRSGLSRRDAPCDRCIGSRGYAFQSKWQGGFWCPPLRKSP